eukprot:6528762-Alexandrium_andersonii.AAC.1
MAAVVHTRAGLARTLAGLLGDIETPPLGPRIGVGTGAVQALGPGWHPDRCLPHLAHSARSRVCWRGPD